MDRSELAAIIAHTLPTLPSHMASTARETRNRPLSPKQEFQSRIRTFNGRPPARHVHSEPDTTTLSKGASRSHELHHVSTLRVQHQQPSFANSSKTPITALPDVSNGFESSPPVSFPESITADFSAEERKAWSRNSPRTSLPTGQPRHTFRDNSTPRGSNRQTQSILAPPFPRLEPPSQPRKQARHPSLRNFEPQQTDSNIDERPKARHGPPPASLRWPAESDNLTEDELAAQRERDAKSRRTRHSKFLEGSMNGRSVGVASSWDEHTATNLGDKTNASKNDTDTDTDATPRASQARLEFGALIGDNEKPLPPTPATTKKGLFRLGGHHRSTEGSARPAEIKVRNTKERKGLRKSLSMWDFLPLGDKSKHLASETTFDVSNNYGQEKIGTARKSTTEVNSTHILNERKRKAEEAYAQQFGMKKQKANVGMSAATTPAPAPITTHDTNKTTSDKHTTTPQMKLRRKRDSHHTENRSQDLSSNCSDTGKRLSKKELQKENQQLRLMLRASQSMTFSQSNSSSSVHLQRSGKENHVAGPVVMLSPGKNLGYRGEDIPPLPKLPGSASGETGALLKFGNEVTTNRDLGYPSAQETIQEESSEELALSGNGETGIPMMEQGNGQGQVWVGEAWEWPEDVF